jgi:hypothetical protein
MQLTQLVTVSRNERCIRRCSSSCFLTDMGGTYSEVYIPNIPQLHTALFFSRFHVIDSYQFTILHQSTTILSVYHAVYYSFISVLFLSVYYSCLENFHKSAAEF